VTPEQRDAKNAWNRRYYAANRERIRAQQAGYREANREKIAAHERERYAEDWRYRLAKIMREANRKRRQRIADLSAQSLPSIQDFLPREE